MSFEKKDLKCVVCSEDLKDTDDVVFCPECGAPHHRECYNKLGECGLAARHKTEEEYQRPEPEVTKTPEEALRDKDGAEEELSIKKACPSCFKEIPDDTRFCPFCGVPVSEPRFEAKIFRLPKIDKKAIIAERVTADDAAKVVYLNPFRYISKFLKLQNGKRISWNWAAFIIPGAWLAYRKMYKQSFAVTTLLIAATLFNIPFNVAVNNCLPVVEEGLGVAELLSYYAEFLPAIGILPIVLVLFGFAAGLFIHIFVGMYGDYIYKNHVIDAVRTIKEAEDEEEVGARLSGVSVIGFIIAFCALEFLPNIISMLIPF